VWDIHPSIIPFLTPIDIRDKESLFQISMVPVNHNQLDQSKATQIVHTILGNAFKSENDPSLANQDFGNDACVLVGCNESVEGAITNKVTMRNLHPNTEIDSKHTVWRNLFPNDVVDFRERISSSEFKELLRTDATTHGGQNKVAEFYGIEELWTNRKQKSPSAMKTYIKLLKMVKTSSKSDDIWISFWEGMHRHAAIMMSLLGADITHNTKSCYKPNTLEKTAFSTYITGFINPGQPPLQIIEEIFNGNNEQATMLKKNMMVTAYIPNSKETEIQRIFKAMVAQSKHVCDNKHTSAARTLPTLLSDWLRQCAPKPMNNVPDTPGPAIEIRFTIQTAMDAAKYNTYKQTHNEVTDTKNMTDITIKNWLPKCITDLNWISFIRNPFDMESLREFTQLSLTSKTKDSAEMTCSPPHRITFRSITKNVLPITKGTQNVDVRQMNAYQIIPGLVYTLHSKLSGHVLKEILNNDDVIKIINYITRYCYATRSSPYVTMHGACQDYGIPIKQYLSSCEGEFEILPVTVLLVSMYNACYTFQPTTDKRENLLTLALEKLELGSRGAITEKAFVRTLSKSR
jgi:hypothetical protein